MKTRKAITIFAAIFAAMLAAMLTCAIALAQYNSANYHEQGGAKWVVGGELEISSGATFDINSDLTLENEEVITNSTDAVLGFTFNDDAVELGDIQIYSSNTSVSDFDYLRISFWAEEGSSTKIELADIDVFMDDVTTGSVDATIEWSVITAGSLAGELNLDGAALYPEADEGLDLGKTGAEFQDLWLDGTANIDVLTPSSIVLPISTVSLTTPTTAFSVTGASLIILTADENREGLTMTGGTQYQIVRIMSGAGSDTLRFDDDADNMALGGNITLTEGQRDVLTLICTNVGGTTFAAVSAHDN